MTTAEDFDKFAQGIDAKAEKAAVAVPEVAPAVEAPPVDATPKPAEKPAEAKAEPVVAKSTESIVKDEPKAEVQAEAPKPAVEEPARDDKGRFVKVAVHAREISKRDAEIETLKHQIEDLQKAKPTVKNIEAFEKFKEKFSEELPAAFKEMFGVLESEILSRDEKLAAMQAKIDEAEQSRQSAEQVEADKAAEASFKAAEQVPVIQGWWDAAQAENATDEVKTVWATAVEHDNFLKQAPAWASKPITERFAEVARRTALDLGIELPKVEPKVEVKAEVIPPKVETPKAELPPKALPAAPLPASLSNIPGPAASPATPKIASEGMSLHAAINATKGMSRAQAERFLLHGSTG